MAIEGSSVRVTLPQNASIYDTEAEVNRFETLLKGNIAEGEAAWDAVVDATLHRLGPIALTAAAAILAMLPIAPEGFWGPMAYAIIGGLIVATLLTLQLLPAPYVAWFRIHEPSAVPAPQRPGAATTGLFTRWFARSS